MKDARRTILTKLRAAPRPFTALPIPDSYLPVTPLDDTSPAALQDRFVHEARSLGCRVYPVSNQSGAIAYITDLLGADTELLSWDPDRIPLPGLKSTLARSGVRLTTQPKPHIRLGLSGADAALAATGSLVLSGDKGKPRLASLLPPIHIAVITADQILPNLETWLSLHCRSGLDTFRAPSSHIVVSGPSRTADIAMQLVMGVHGPGELHIVVLSAH